jgi:glyoxylase-like metal-dependent hydrolase (beta-lactamase superfamily II)
MTRPTRWNRAAPIRTTRVGAHRLTYLPDGVVQLDPTQWYPRTDPAVWRGEWHHLLDPEGYLTASIGGLLIEFDERAMLIDAGFGPRTIPAARTHPALGELAGGDLLTALKQVGRQPSDIETVAFTHLHDDHFGWVLRPGPEGTPFAAAGLAAGAEDWGVWREPLPKGLRPIGVRDGEAVFPGVRALATPGHTPGHTSYLIESEGERLLVIGDALHSPAQVANPEWMVLMDVDPVRGVASRRAVLSVLAEAGVRGFGIHFADVGFGRVLTEGGVPAWVPDADEDDQ